MQAQTLRVNGLLIKWIFERHLAVYSVATRNQTPGSGTRRKNTPVGYEGITIITTVTLPFGDQDPNIVGVYE